MLLFSIDLVLTKLLMSENINFVHITKCILVDKNYFSVYEMFMYLTLINIFLLNHVFR